MKGRSTISLLFALVASVCFSFPSPSLAQVSQTWTNLGLYGGQVNDIAIDPVNPNKMFAATYKGDGLFVTRDGGISWQPVEMDIEPAYQGTFKNHSVYGVRIAPSDSNVVWVVHNYWIAKSNDGGETWAHIDVYDLSWNARVCRSIAVDHSDPQTVYVGTSGASGTGEYGAVYKTDDGGVTWNKMNQGLDFDFTVVDIEIDPQNGHTIWAVTSSEGYDGILGGTLYRSADGAENWEGIFSLTPYNGEYFSVAVKPDDSNTVFTASEGNSGSDYDLGILKHQFDGGSWTQERPFESISEIDVAFDPQNHQILYTSSSKRLRKSSDGGVTWQTYAHENTFSKIVVHPTRPDVLFGGDLYLGIYKTAYDDTADNYVWTPINDGLNAVLVYDVAIDPNASTHILAGAISGVYEKKSGNSWSRILELSTQSVQFHPTDSQVFYAGVQARLAKTEDGGASWTYWRHDDTFNYVTAIAIDPTDTETMFIAVASAGGDYGEIYKSTDAGDSFSMVLDGVNRYGQPYGFNIVAIDPSDPQHLFAGGGNVAVPLVLGDLWESTNGGNDWHRTGLQFEFVNDVLIDPRDSNVMYAGCGASGGTSVPVYLSTDGGDTWVPSHEGIPGPQRGLTGLSGISGDVAFAVGPDGDIFRYDGSVWTAMRSTTTEFLEDVWTYSAADAFAVGDRNTILHLDANGWSAMSESLPGLDFYGVWGSRSVDPDRGLANDVFSVGGLYYYGVIYHYDGSTWGLMDSPIAGFLMGIWGSASVNSATGLANDVFAVGSVIQYYDGSTWELMDSPTTELLTSVWGTASTNTDTGLTNDVFAVGTSGAIIHYNGSTWEVMGSPTAETLRDVWGSQTVDPSTGLATDVYAVGNTGTILHYDGRTWNEMVTPTEEDLLSVWGASSTDVYATSGYGTILHYDGTAWSVMKTAGAAYNSVTDLEFHPQNKDVVYAGTSQQGVYVSPVQAGNWLNLGVTDYTLYAISTGSLYAATEGGLLQCTGTGLVTGRIADASTGNAIDNATIYTDFGLNAISYGGQYMMINPSGIFAVTAVADEYKNSTQEVTVLGGNVSWANFSMQSGYPDPTRPPGSSDTSSSGSYCFINSAADRSLPAKASRALDPLCEHAGCIVSANQYKRFLCLCLLMAGLFALGRHQKKRRPTHRPTSVHTVAAILTLAVVILIVAASSLQAATLFQNVGVASSPNPVGSGARALGMGGAFIGVADDATAASWNPAGIIHLERPELSIVSDYNKRKEEFSSTMHPESNNTGDVDDVDLNYFSAAYPFHLFRNMVVSINYQRLYDFKRNFSHRYDYASTGVNLVQEKSFSQDGSIGALGLAGAIQITPQISLGATLNIWTDALWWENGWDETFTEHGVGTLSGLPVSIGTRIVDKYSNFRGINANFGLLWNLNRFLTIGAVVKTPFTANICHEFDYHQTQSYGDPLDTASSIHQHIKEDVKLDMPMSYGIGLAWRFSDAFSMDVDVYRTEWRKYILTDDRGNEFSPIDGRPKSQSDVDDTTQVRIGAEYLFIMQNKNIAIPVRAGFFYDPEPSEGSPEDFYGCAIGLGIAYEKLIVDMAYQLRWGNDVDTGNLIAGSTADVIQHTLLASLIIHF